MKIGQVDNEVIMSRIIYFFNEGVHANSGRLKSNLLHSGITGPKFTKITHTFYMILKSEWPYCNLFRNRNARATNKSE